MTLKEELKRVEFAMKIDVGGGALGRIDRWLFLVAKQLGREAAKRNCHCEAKSCKGIIKIFEYSLSQSHSIKKVVKSFTKKESIKLFNLTNCKISSLQGRESSRLNEVNYGYERGVNKEKFKNTDRATECAMTNVGANILKIASHSEDNVILSPKNLLKVLQEGLSLDTQDDENTEIFVPSPKFLSSL